MPESAIAEMICLPMAIVVVLLILVAELSCTGP
jgi:hypothetical protein